MEIRARIIYLLKAYRAAVLDGEAVNLKETLAKATSVFTGEYDYLRKVERACVTSALREEGFLAEGGHTPSDAEFTEALGLALAEPPQVDVVRPPDVITLVGGWTASVEDAEPE